MARFATIDVGSNSVLIYIAKKDRRRRLGGPRRKS